MTKEKEKISCKRYRISALFNCCDCSKEWQGLSDAREKAYEHSVKTGHKVRGEIATAYHYN